MRALILGTFAISLSACMSLSPQEQLVAFKRYPSSVNYKKIIDSCAMLNPSVIPIPQCYYQPDEERILLSALTSKDAQAGFSFEQHHVLLKIASPQLVTSLKKAIKLGLAKQKGNYGSAIPFLHQQAMQLRSPQSLSAMTDLVLKYSWKDLGAVDVWDINEFYGVANLFNKPETLAMMVNQISLQKNEKDFSQRVYDRLTNEIIKGAPMMQTVRSQLARSLESMHPEMMLTSEDETNTSRAELLTVKMAEKQKYLAACLYLTVTDRTITQIRSNSDKPILIQNFNETQGLLPQALAYYRKNLARD